MPRRTAKPRASAKHPKAPRLPDDEGPEDDNPIDDSPDYIDDTFNDRLDEEHRTPPDSSETDDPPDYIEDNDPEDALKNRDPDRPLLDHQDPDAGVKEIKQPENPDARSPE
jgi:hypothetical protein